MLKDLPLSPTKHKSEKAKGRTQKISKVHWKGNAVGKERQTFQELFTTAAAGLPKKASRCMAVERKGRI